MSRHKRRGEREDRWVVNNNDERDYAEESANRAEMESDADEVGPSSPYAHTPVWVDAEEPLDGLSAAKMRELGADVEDSEIGLSIGDPTVGLVVLHGTATELMTWLIRASRQIAIETAGVSNV